MQDDFYFLFSWIGKVFVIIYGGKVRGKNMVDVLCMSNGLKQWVDVVLTNIAINYLIDCLIYFSLSLFLSCIYIIHEVVLMNVFRRFFSEKTRISFDEMKVVQRLNNVLF